MDRIGEEMAGASSVRRFDDKLDLEILQMRARKWIQAVLGEELPPSVPLATLLADGVLLARVGQTVAELYRKALQLPPSEEAGWHAGSKEGRSGAPRSGAWGTKVHWDAIDNVDSFLRVCREVGLKDLDLCTPPDVVESRSARSVCLCIRTLAVRLLHLHVFAQEFEPAAASAHNPATHLSSGRAPACGPHVESVVRKLDAGYANEYTAIRASLTAEDEEDGFGWDGNEDGYSRAGSCAGDGHAEAYYSKQYAQADADDAIETASCRVPLGGYRNRQAGSQDRWEALSEGEEPRARVRGAAPREGEREEGGAGGRRGQDRGGHTERMGGSDSTSRQDTAGPAEQAPPDTASGSRGRSSRKSIDGSASRAKGRAKKATKTSSAEPEGQAAPRYGAGKAPVDQLQNGGELPVRAKKQGGSREKESASKKVRKGKGVQQREDALTDGDDRTPRRNSMAGSAAKAATGSAREPRSRGGEVQQGDRHGGSGSNAARRRVGAATRAPSEELQRALVREHQRLPLLDAVLSLPGAALVGGAVAAAGLLGAVLFLVLPRRKEYHVKEGDYLIRIANKVGKKDWKEIYEHNPGIQNPDIIKADSILKL